MKVIKLFGYSIYKTKEIEPVLQDKKDWEFIINDKQSDIDILNKRIKVLETLLDMSQYSVTQLNRR